MPQVTFKPDEVTVTVERGESVLRAAVLADVPLSASCGGNGSCGKCRVIVERGSVETRPSARLTSEQIEDGHVLACQSGVLEDVTIRIPPESRPGRAPDRDASSRTPNPLLSPSDRMSRMPRGASVPPVSKRVVRMSPPDLTDNLNDASRVRLALKKQHGIRDATISLPALRELSTAARQGDWVVTAFAAEPCNTMPMISGFQAGDTSAWQYAVAVDIGTTSVEIALLDVNSGEVIATLSEYNAQVTRGEDVISRVVASAQPGGLQELHDLVVGTIRDLVEQALSMTGARAEDVVSYYVAGNTVMTYLLLRISPEFVRESPFVPTATSFPWLRATELGLPGGRATRMYVAPCPASWLGGDIVSGVIAAGIPWTDRLTLFIDVGTNGEIVLGNREWLVSCSCSAGPAFEGGGILHGMRAADGAIELVRVDDETLEPTILTVGGARPLGICGSGLIDTVSELFLCGVLERDGRFRDDLASDHVVRRESGRAYVLVGAEGSGTGQPIVLTEGDVKNLMRAKAAFHAGVSVLIESLDLSLDAIEEVVIAGGFGHYLDIKRVMALGMVPEIAPDRFVFMGNSSLAGARILGQSREALLTARRIAEAITYLELSVNAGFMEHYTSAMFFPHTNTALFPETERVRAQRAAARVVV